jgi:hypothetical protein
MKKSKTKRSGLLFQNELNGDRKPEKGKRKDFRGSEPEKETWRFTKEFLSPVQHLPITIKQ